VARYKTLEKVGFGSNFRINSYEIMLILGKIGQLPHSETWQTLANVKVETKVITALHFQ